MGSDGRRNCFYTPVEHRWRLAILLVVALVACRSSDPLSDVDYDAAASVANEATLSRRLDELAADSMLGRGPGQRGDTMTVAYLEAQMRAIGLAPMNDSGYRQPVALRRLHADGEGTFRVNGRAVPLDASSGVIFAANKLGTHAVSDAPVVFVGHGIVAPEHGWDDYGEIDLRGKVALILDGEPVAVRRRRFGTRGNGSPHGLAFLKGRHALARGAVGVVIIRTGTDAVHRARRRRLQDDVLMGEVDDATPDPAVTLHLSQSAGEALANAVGTRLAVWQAAAEDPTVGPQDLPLRLDASVSATGARFISHNVVGVVVGSDPVLRGECVVYLGHWDGYGVGLAVAGDSIYNGALDDAAGVSSMLLVAEAVRALPRAPRRTMVFVATTAEESGMRGADAYVANPVCPLERTTLAVGMDWTWTWGMTDTIVSNGFGYSTVDSLAERVATRHAKAFAPGLGEYWLASDHAALVLRGVPAWFGGLDGEVRGRPAGWAAAQLATQVTHVPSDERKESWNLAGAVFEVRFVFELGVRAAESELGPTWTAQSEFRRAAAARRSNRP